MEAEYQTVIFNASSTLVKIKTIFTADKPCFLLASAVHIFHHDAAKIISLRSGYQFFTSEAIDGTASVVGLFSLKNGESVDLYTASTVDGIGTNPINCCILKFDI